jgi:hypothetical protein
MVHVVACDVQCSNFAHLFPEDIKLAIINSNALSVAILNTTTYCLSKPKPPFTIIGLSTYGTSYQTSK